MFVDHCVIGPNMRDGVSNWIAFRFTGQRQFLSLCIEWCSINFVNRKISLSFYFIFGTWFIGWGGLYLIQKIPSKIGLNNVKLGHRSKCNWSQFIIMMTIINSDEIKKPKMNINTVQSGWWGSLIIAVSGSNCLSIITKIFFLIKIH